MTHASFGERGALFRFFEDEPDGRAVARANEQKLFIGGSPSEVTYLCACQTAAAHETVLRPARPTSLDKQFAHAQMQCQKTANHRRAARRETVRVHLCDLNTCACAIGFTGERLEGRK